MAPLHTTLRLAFWATLVEAVLGVILSGIYVLYYFCAASVSCPPASSEDDALSSLQQVFFLFFTTYVVGDGEECSNNPMTNDNPLTKPEVIFLWQIMFLVLYLTWVAAALLLQQVDKKRQVGWPWVVVTVVVVVGEVVAASLVATDLDSAKYPGSTNWASSCPAMVVDSQEEANTRKDKATVVMMVVFLRCGVFLPIHLFTLGTITYSLCTSAPALKARPPGGRSESTQDLWVRGGPPAPEPELWAPAGPAPPNHFVPDRKVSEVRREPSLPSLPRAHYTPQYAAPRPPVDHPVAPRAPMEYPADPRPPAPDHRPPVPTSRPPTTTTDRGTVRRAPSFADRLRHAESGGGGREGPLWGYSDPGVRRQLMDRTSGGRQERHLDQDVDSAFNFLETYSTRGEEEVEERETVTSYSSYLADTRGEEGIPRARAPHPGPATRYFVPLKS